MKWLVRLCVDHVYDFVLHRTIPMSKFGETYDMLAFKGAFFLMETKRVIIKLN